MRRRARSFATAILAAMLVFATHSAFAEPKINLRVDVQYRAGNTLNARLATIPDSCGMYIHGNGINGNYRYYPHDGQLANTFFIEVSLDGYKPRVLECGRDFSPEDRVVSVVLEEGPFGEKESVFAAVTGREPTEAEVAAMPHAGFVRGRERDYRYQAAKGRVPEEELPPRQRQGGFQIYWGPSPASPQPNVSLVELVDNSLNDVVTLPRVHIIDDKGIPVTEVRVQWAKPDGLDPATGAPTGIAYQYWPVRTLRNCDGTYTVPQNCLVWAEGRRQVFVPASTRRPAVPKSITLISGETPQEERKSDYVLAREIERLLGESSKSGPPSEVTEKRKKEAAAVLRRRLKDKKAFNNIRPSEAYDPCRLLADLEGDKATRLLASIARDKDREPFARRSALVGLGRIGSKKSLKIVKEMRDAARAAPDAPQEKDAYTHAERIAEAIEMTCVFIPGVDPKSRWAFSSAYRFYVDQDYTTATAHCGSVMESTDMHLRRVGDEWFVVEIGSTICI